MDKESREPADASGAESRKRPRFPRRFARDSEVSTGEFAAGAGFEVGLECDGLVLRGKSYGRFDAPRAMPSGMRNPSLRSSRRLVEGMGVEPTTS